MIPHWISSAIKLKFYRSLVVSLRGMVFVIQKNKKKFGIQGRDKSRRSEQSKFDDKYVSSKNSSNFDTLLYYNSLVTVISQKILNQHQSK